MSDIPTSREVNRSIHQQVERLQWHQHRERIRDLESALSALLAGLMGVPMPTDLWSARDRAVKVLSRTDADE